MISADELLVIMDALETERDMLRAEREVWGNIAQERNDLRAEVERLHKEKFKLAEQFATERNTVDRLVRAREQWEAENERLTLADNQWADHVKRVADERDELRAENRWLRARVCYVNPDGSHVRGCAQHEAMHPAQWCEALARANCGYV